MATATHRAPLGPNLEEAALSPIRPGRHRRLVRENETYTGDTSDTDLEPVDPDEVQLPEADQHGDLEHEGGPDDGSH